MQGSIPLSDKEGIISVKFMNMKKTIYIKLLMFVVVCGLSICAIKSQEASTVVSARVINEAGQPVSNVMVSGTLGNTVTGPEGSFSLEVPSGTNDQLIIDERGYKLTTVEVLLGSLPEEEIVLFRKMPVEGNRKVTLPYQDFVSERSVSATNTISGTELTSYPTTSALEALSGRIPGLVINKHASVPGHENISATIRGVPALVYIDGILRDPSDLTVYEIDQVEVIKDFSGRAALGITGANPVIWITTKTGESLGRRTIDVTANMGLSNPALLPSYLDAYSYATLFNEARANDGLSPVYSQTALNAYRDGTDPLRYPNIDYYDRYVKPATTFRQANVQASGGTDIVEYFSMLDYVGSGGLEAEGEEATTDRYKIRGNVKIDVTRFMSMNVNLSGTYGKSRFPNVGGSANLFNMFQLISNYPSNAHPIEHDGRLMQSADYPVNLTNVLMHSGFAENTDLNTQNSVSLNIDLGSITDGLTFDAKAAFDINNSVTNNKGGSRDIYRLATVGDRDTLVRHVEAVVDPVIAAGYDFFLRRTSGTMALNYNKAFDMHELSMHASYFQMLEEIKVTIAGYQPNKMQDMSFRANYAFDRRYILQLDLSYSGNMKLPAGERFNLFPTIGAAWVASNESFLQNNNLINHLKLYSSYGVMGVDNFYIPGYDQYYLDQTIWRHTGNYQSGIEGQRGGSVRVYDILQTASDDFTIPKRSLFNLGVQGLFFNNSLTAEVNYFYRKNFDQVSVRQHTMPSLFGTGGFLPVTNYGEDMHAGVDGFIQYRREFGNFRFSAGVNAMYSKGEYLVVDEPEGLPDYRRLTGTATDLYWIYQAEGLFQSQAEVDAYTVTQGWGPVRPGDIRYKDMDGDGLIDERDMHAPGAHAPRVSYGLNLSLGYKGFNLFLVGKGVTAGEVMLSHPNYFWISSTTQNYSEPMLDRWPNTNDYPRLTTVSRNNYQPSTFWMANATYLSLSNVELSYTFPKTFSQRLLISDFRLFARGRNLLYISDLTDYGVNPENMSAGISTYPILRSLTFGISCKF